MNWLTWLFAKLQPAPPARPRLQVGADGFELTTPGERGARVVRWAAVTRIHTYKLDLYTTDCICLAFELDDGTPLQVTEDTVGFKDLFEPLSKTFASVPADWYLQAMVGAFETNHQVLYERTACV